MNTDNNFAAKKEDLMNKEFDKKNLNNFDKDKKDSNPVNPEDINEKKKEELIDPMACEESSEDLEAKKQKWMDIFQRCPDFSNWILEVYEGTGSVGLEDIKKHFEG